MSVILPPERNGQRRNQSFHRIVTQTPTKMTKVEVAVEAVDDINGTKRRSIKSEDDTVVTDEIVNAEEEVEIANTEMTAEILEMTVNSRNHVHGIPPM